eukprot:s3839_g7.t1
MRQSDSKNGRLMMFREIPERNGLSSQQSSISVSQMQLRYYLNENGKRVYTLDSVVQAEGEEEKPTFSAHPARFSPDDKYSEHRIKGDVKLYLHVIVQETLRRAENAVETRRALIWLCGSTPTFAVSPQIGVTRDTAFVQKRLWRGKSMPLQLAPLHSHDPPFQLPVSGSVTIGRRPNNTLVCNDISVSGKHCEISIASGSVKISDCSTNGTYINDERIVKGEVAEVHPGDVIALTKPHPPGALDSTVEAAIRVQFRLEHANATGAQSDANGNDNLTSTALRGEPAATFSQSCPPNPPKRASTTAEGFAHDLLMQEQQLLAKESQLCKAKITGELLLARRRLDEERSKSDSLARDLRKAKANLEEERRRKSAALDGREALKAEAAKLKDNRHQLPEMRSTQTSLQQKHEALEIELTTYAQKAAWLRFPLAKCCQLDI